ncbi:SpoIIE family protein phosphatase [Sporomusa malonica]|uniref:Serine phosphatase RsbU, regulator of sigma subunit n=1 Tax=Sporomusa malonica TaxID=112901 RepID=A0A1W1ZU61_9FIRM|nr:SpoIIE family protein phosphatase [Sporomusa malonica]SMC51762.1 Serine phosphatase RsbU, regulator of sigma subunit [Sporomusa malonica]
MSRMNNDLEPQVPPPDRTGIIHDRGTIKVVVFACFIIVLAVVLTGGISYFITRNAVVDKLKSRDLVYIIESISAKIDGRVERAKETSLILAKDQAIIQWIASAEKDEKLGEYSKAKINEIAQNYDYANSFIVSAITKNYWAEGSKIIKVMSKTDPNASWFYEALKSRKAVDLKIDYDSGRRDTFVFLNALVGDVEHPIAVTGVGLSLKDIAQEFQRYKFGEKSNLWLVDSKGKIHLSDDFSHNGRYLNDFVPSSVVSQVIQDKDDISSKPQIIEYIDAHGETVDLAYQSTKSTDWKVVFQIPRSESIAILGNIKLNTAIASLVALLLMIFVFYTVSRRIADPLKRALLLTQEMEKQVNERTRELAEKNQRIIDSIDYAKRLQESILPTAEELRTILGDYFILWKPRDIVGGDFYWVRRIDDDRSLVALADCTGHGVPGAFMTMAVNSILNHIVDQNHTDPADILAELNRRMKATLHRNDQCRMVDDGLDIAICCIEKNERLTFAGAKIPLYIKRGDQIHVIKGDKRSIGYRRSSNDLEFTNHSWEIEAQDRFYLTTDGYIDQNGGVKDYPLGRKKLIQAIIEQDAKPLPEQQEAFEAVLSNYMGNESQRDDITIVGFSL